MEQNPKVNTQTHFSQNFPNHRKNSYRHMLIQFASEFYICTVKLSGGSNNNNFKFVATMKNLSTVNNNYMTFFLK